MTSFPTHAEHSPPTLPCVRHTADDGAEHEGSNKRKEHQVDQAFQTIITQPRHCLYIVLRREKKTFTIYTIYIHISFIHFLTPLNPIQECRCMCGGGGLVPIPAIIL